MTAPPAVAAPPRCVLIALAHCQDCNWITYAQATSHDRAKAHAAESGHRVHVVETTTTSYEATHG